MIGVDGSLLDIYHRLHALGLPVMVGGSVAAMIYGEPRATLDLDVVLEAGPSSADAILAAFPSPEFQVPPVDALTRELSRTRDGSFQILSRESLLKTDVFLAGNDPLLEFGLANVLVETIDGREVRFASATYVVIIKLRYYAMSQQAKHRDDIRTILSTSPEAMDLEAVEKWVDVFDLHAEWTAIRDASQG